MSKLSLQEELHIIGARWCWLTYEQIKTDLHHGESTIARVLERDNLIKVIMQLVIKVNFRIDMLQLDADHYKRMFYISFGCLILQAVANVILFIL